LSESALFPGYIPRDEENRIRELSAQVLADHQTRVILLYGSGGVGKTSMVRHLANASKDDPATTWVGPIDIDDSEYWLLSNLEKLIAESLDPENAGRYFDGYLDYLTRLPQYLRPGIGHETVVSHLARIKDVFVESYKRFVAETGRSVVIVFDTVEPVRGMDLVVTLTQLIRELPATLFIMSGRPMPGDDGRPDPIVSALDDPLRQIPIDSVELKDLSQDAAYSYLSQSGIGRDLDEVEKAILVRLTRGHPLWLAFTVSYLGDHGLPEEAERELAEVEREIPYVGEMTQAGTDLHEAFNRRLVSHYRDTDFWHEAVKRLAVARESVSLTIWRELMSDRPLPDDAASLDSAWPMLQEIPWIRLRANNQYVTLHDVVAEELAKRIFPLHDQGKQWRHELWSRTAGIYSRRITARSAELDSEFAALDETLRGFDSMPVPDGERVPPTEEERAIIKEIARLDVEKRELCRFKAVGLCYQILCNFRAGSRLFLELLAEAKGEHDVLFQDLLIFQMERFLPGGTSYAVDDVIGEVISEYRSWLESRGRELYLEIGLSIADCLIRSEKPLAAIDLLARLPMEEADHRDRFRLNILRGNAYMRIPGQVREGYGHFEAALTVASSLTGQDRLKQVAKAHKELGFYYRNRGLWDQADLSYKQARDAISETLAAGSTVEDREEMASIQTNWAYVKGLGGNYRDGTNLVESAINIRRRLENRPEVAVSLSTCGEVYRYERRFQMAWIAYAEAEQIFQELRNWSWLGLIYQEQAICLYQAAQDGIEVESGIDPAEQSKRLIKRSLDLCRDLAVRGYPSALNRAGRIFAQEDPDAGLGYLDQGIKVARQLSDGWFWFANLIEYVELCYRVWDESRQRSYLDRISSRVPEINLAIDEYEFPDLKGRWNLLRGHLSLSAWLEHRDDTGLLSTALRHYKEGFAQVAQQYVGSSGAAAIAGEFDKFATMVWRLPIDVRARWQEEFRLAWSDTTGSTLLLARLEQLY
jgi:tetratricopeptide (TPR) repeat protein